MSKPSAIETSLRELERLALDSGRRNDESLRRFRELARQLCTRPGVSAYFEVKMEAAVELADVLFNARSRFGSERGKRSDVEDVRRSLLDELNRARDAL